MKKQFFFATAFIWAVSVNAQVVINEIMQSNIDCIMDDLNDFPDSWVELYNAGEEAVDLSNYRLGIKSYKKADQLPAYTLEPGAYALVYCDKALEDWETYKAKDKKDKLNWHMSFRLESAKNCVLYLYDKDKNVVDSLPGGMKKQPAPNIAYGRKKDGGDKWGYQAVPTPGKKNCGTTYGNKDILGDPVFSVPGKVFSKGSYSISLSLPEDAPEGTVIRYTTDGSEPTESSTEYTSPIKFNDTKIIRAKLFCEGMLSPRSAVQSYIKLDRKMTLPVFSIVTDDRYLNDEKIGIMVDGTYTYTSGGNDWWGGGGGGKEEDKNFFYNWRRPMNYEFFEDANTASVINQLGEVRITGGYTRRNALKSLGLYANKRFGEKRLNHEFFPDQRPGITDFKSVMLRDAGNDFDGLYMRDAIIQCSMAKYLDLDWQAWRPAIVYINGVYKGILNIRERSNEDNIYTNYNGLEDIDMVENPWVSSRELKEGTWDSWNAFEKFYKEKGHTYAEYEEWLDVQEFMDIMIFNSFFCNTDFPGNNIVFWRPQEEGSKWRIVVKDTDFGIGLYGKSVDTNYIQWLYNPSGTDANQKQHTELFRNMMEDEDFKREFIDRSAIYMGDFMNFNTVWETWEPMYKAIEYEFPYFRSVFKPDWWWGWGEWEYNFDDYKNTLNSAKNWLQQRTEKHYNHLNSYYKVGKPQTLTINKSVNAVELKDMAVEFNGWELSRGKFDGKFFEGRQVTLRGTKNVKGWRIKQGSTTTEVEGSEYTFTMPAASIAINAIYADPTGIESIRTEASEPAIIDVYDASGMRRNGLQKGFNIIRTNDGKSKSVWF